MENNNTNMQLLEQDECFSVLKTLVHLKEIKDELDLVPQEKQDQVYVNKYAAYVVEKQRAWKDAKKIISEHPKPKTQMFEGLRTLTDFESEVLSETHRKQCKTERTPKQQIGYSEEDIFKQAKKDAERDALKDVEENDVGYDDVYLDWFEIHLKAQFEKILQSLKKPQLTNEAKSNGTITIITHDPFLSDEDIIAMSAKEYKQWSETDIALMQERRQAFIRGAKAIKAALNIK